MYCGSCKYWGEYDNSPKNIKLGHCKKIEMLADDQAVENDDLDLILKDEESKAFVIDGDNYSARLLTRSDFGCIEFVEINGQ